METIGIVRSLHRYPVKSMLGENVAASAVTERGLTGDRTHAVVDMQTGKIASAKRPQLWSKLLKCTARGHQDTAGSVRISLPDGQLLDSADPRTDAILSTFLERSVMLTATAPGNAEIERARPEEVLAQGRQASVTADTNPLGRASPPGTFFDYAPVHLITSATLERISAAADADIAPLRYRPNIIVHTPQGEPFTENTWVGKVIGIGTTLQLRILVTTPRCAVPTLPHGDLSDCPEALRALVKLNRVAIPGIGKVACAGVYAQVVTAGRIGCDDPVHVVSST